MRGKKAKVLRIMAKYDVTAHRPDLPSGGFSARAGTLELSKDEPRHKYHVLKKRYGMVPLAHGLKRMHNSRRLVESLDSRMAEPVSA